MNPDDITKFIVKHFPVDAVYLYGSQATGKTLPKSDVDIAILFTEYGSNRFDRAFELEQIRGDIEQEFDLINRVDVVDVELVPVSLARNITEYEPLIVMNQYHRFRLENSIHSKVEIDYVAEL